MKHASYKWIITKDFSPQPGALAGTNGNALGLAGPRGADDSITADQLPDKFKMYDDDGELMYEGVCNCLTTDACCVDGFEPLDDFGMPNAGCTRIDYLEDGKWNTL